MNKYTRLLLQAFLSLMALLVNPVHADVSIDDWRAIQDVMSRYAFTWDSKHAEQHVNLFTENGISQIIYAGNILSETTSNSERLTRTQNRLSEFTSKGISSRHILSNMILKTGSEGEITGKTYFYVVLTTEGEAAPTPKYTGVYKDTFSKTEEGWKISHHEAHLDQNL